MAQPSCSTQCVSVLAKVANTLFSVPLKMGGEGKYAVFVGSLTVPLHNAWADAANAFIAENYPDIELVGERYGVAENVDDSRKTALDLIAAHPDLKGILAFGSQGPIGAGRAIEERRLGGQVHVLGPFSPGQGQKLVQSGISQSTAVQSPPFQPNSCRPLLVKL